MSQNNMNVPTFLEKDTQEVNVSKSNMTTIEKEEFMSVARAMTDEEKILVLRTVSNDDLMREVTRRLSAASSTLNQIRSIMSGRHINIQDVER